MKLQTKFRSREIDITINDIEYRNIDITPEKARVSIECVMTPKDLMKFMRIASEEEGRKKKEGIYNVDFVRYSQSRRKILS